MITELERRCNINNNLNEIKINHIGSSMLVQTELNVMKSALNNLKVMLNDDIIDATEDLNGDGEL